MIQVFDDFDRLSQAAAALIVAQACQAVASRGRFCLALSGGRTPQLTYQKLAQVPFLEQVPWAQVHVFWGDERCVPEDDIHSNVRMAREALLEHVPLPPEQIYPMACAGDPVAAARGYEKLLQRFFPPGEPSFDLILLGLGEDGHTASLFPGTRSLQETVRLVTALHLPEEKFVRLTLTPPVINRSRLAVFLVSGQNKAEILHRVLSAPQGRFPAQLIAPHETRWLIDKEATSRIESTQI